MKGYKVGHVTLEINSIDHQAGKVKCYISQSHLILHPQTTPGALITTFCAYTEKKSSYTPGYILQMNMNNERVL